MELSEAVPFDPEHHIHPAPFPHFVAERGTESPGFFARFSKPLAEASVNVNESKARVFALRPVYVPGCDST